MLTVMCQFRRIVQTDDMSIRIGMYMKTLLLGLIKQVLYAIKREWRVQDGFLFIAVINQATIVGEEIV